MVFKCKLCGGELNVDSTNNVCVCQYCKTKQTVPNINTEREHQLFDRANYYRFSNEFDKALTIYEQILEINSKESEAFWGILLCRYGVEYVEDQKTKKRVPTCHRTSYESILNDLNYKSALKYATKDAGEIYEKEAKYIDNVQKKIKEISSKEEPFDIFISYKESNGNERTIDSVIAEEIYENLKQKGYKVFFSRISLEGKLGIEYEPYIFAALNSAKIMLVVGTNKENMNSVWVRNEWKRYLSLIKDGKEKVLIPCYKEMDPYDMPDEFSALQAQDMKKIGAMQDLLRGIDKIIKPSDDQINADKVDYYILKKSLEKAFEFIQQEKWEEAKKRLDNAQDYDSHSAKIYLAYLLIDLKLHSIEELENYPNDYFDNKNYKTAIKYADNELIATLEKYKKSTEKVIEEKNKEQRKKKNKIKKVISIILSVLVSILIITLIITKLIIPCIKYTEATKLIEQENYEMALEKLEEAIYIKDAKEKKMDCFTQIQIGLIKENSQNDLDSRVKENLDNIGDERVFKIAKTYFEKGNPEKVEELYENIKEYKDSNELYAKAKYEIGVKKYNSGDVENSLIKLKESKDLGFEDAKNKLEEFLNEIYNKAMQEYDKTNYGTAKKFFEQLKKYEYKDSNGKYNSCINIIEQEKSQYYGVWLQPQGFYYDFKIDENGVYCSPTIDRKFSKREWSTHYANEYNINEGAFNVESFDDTVYELRCIGDKLVAKIIKEGKYSGDWLSDYNTFYRQK